MTVETYQYRNQSFSKVVFLTEATLSKAFESPLTGVGNGQADFSSKGLNGHAVRTGESSNGAVNGVEPVKHTLQAITAPVAEDMRQMQQNLKSVSANTFQELRFVEKRWHRCSNNHWVDLGLGFLC